MNLTTVRTAKEANKIPRFDWKTLLGLPLRDWCYKQFSAGASQKYCRSAVFGKLKEYYDRSMWLGRDVAYISLNKAQENAKIGISAAYSEWKRVKKRWYY